jgi:hypothetical protein
MYFIISGWGINVERTLSNWNLCCRFRPQECPPRNPNKRRTGFPVVGNSTIRMTLIHFGITGLFGSNSEASVEPNEADHIPLPSVRFLFLPLGDTAVPDSQTVRKSEFVCEISHIRSLYNSWILFRFSFTATTSVFCACRFVWPPIRFRLCVNSCHWENFSCTASYSVCCS